MKLNLHRVLCVGFRASGSRFRLRVLSLGRVGMLNVRRQFDRFLMLRERLKHQEIP